MKISTFLITISVPGDISDNSVNSILAYCKKKCRYSYLVCERGTTCKRHLHVLMCMKVACEKNDMLTYLWTSIVQRDHADAKKSVAMNCHVQYDHNWYDTYLLKEEERELIYDNYDRDEVGKWFPTEGEQEQLMQAVATGRSVGSVADSYIDKLVAAWVEYDGIGSDYEDAGRYINYRMYVARDMTCIRDVRRLSQLCWTMFCYRTHRIENSTEFVRLGNQMTGNCL